MIFHVSLGNAFISAIAMFFDQDKLFIQNFNIQEYSYAILAGILGFTNTAAFFGASYLAPSKLGQITLFQYFAVLFSFASELYVF